VEARDLREPEPEPLPELEPEPETTEFEAVAEPESEPVAVVAAEESPQPHLEGVTESADWAWDDPEDYSAPV
jgi:hypothetical protein